MKRLITDAQYINDVNVEPFTTDEILINLRSCNFGSASGKDGVLYADIMTQWNTIKNDVCNIFNTVLNNERASRDWKHALIKRTPKKNYSENDLTSLRDISLLPCLYKLFMKCLVSRIKHRVMNNIVGYWQRAYLPSRDRQELIFCLKTALDDFRHISSPFYGLFIDFRDAFGSIKQEVMIQDLIDAGIEKPYCSIIADIYQDSFFEVLCDDGLSKEIELTVGVKTGDPGSQMFLYCVAG